MIRVTNSLALSSVGYPAKNLDLRIVDNVLFISESNNSWEKDWLVPESSNALRTLSVTKFAVFSGCVTNSSFSLENPSLTESSSISSLLEP